jgi:hypothetical protein
MRSEDRSNTSSLWNRIGVVAAVLPGSTLYDMMGRHPRQQLTWLGLLAAPLLLPVAIPGMATTVGAFCLLVAVSTFLARPLPLPQWLQRRKLPVSLGQALQRVVHRLAAVLARISKPRLLRLSRPSCRFINGAMLALAGASMMVPVPVVSFDNVVPAAAVVLLAWGMRIRDGAMLVLGYVTTLLAWIYVAALWWAGAEIIAWLYRLLLRAMA